MRPTTVEATRVLPTMRRTVIDPSLIPRLIPATKKGEDFLSSSHYEIGFEGKEKVESMKSITRSDFQPMDKPETPRIRHYEEASFDHVDHRRYKDQISETQFSFPPPLEEAASAAAAAALPEAAGKSDVLATNFKMGTLESVLLSTSPPTTHLRSFPPQSLRDSNPRRFRPEAMKSSLTPPRDGREGEKKSDYKENFLAPNCSRDQRQFPLHLLPTKTLCGDRGIPGMWTSASAEHFKRKKGRRPSACPSKHHGTDIPGGDKEKLKEELSSVQDSYRGHPTQALADPYDKRATLADIHRSNFRCGDPISVRPTYQSVTKRSYQLSLSPNAVSRVSALHLLQDSIPSGPDDVERFLTTNERFHQHQGNYSNNFMDGGDFITASNVHLTDKSQAAKFYDATTKSTYLPFLSPSLSRPPPVVPTQFVDVSKSWPLPKSTNAATYRRHPLREKYNPIVAADLRCSHVRFPTISSSHEYSTEAADSFVVKSGVKEKTNAHRHWKSSVPIGTMDKYLTY